MAVPQSALADDSANAGLKSNGQPLQGVGAEPVATPLPQKFAPDANPAGETRNFYQVLDDVLADFEYDLKNGQVNGLKDLSIRNIATSENVPSSFKQHIEALVTERIQKNIKTRIVHCLACRSKRAVLSADNVLISNPESNEADLVRIAKMNNIQNFMDIAYAYEPQGMLLSLSIYDAETGTMIWSHTYNSETSRAEAFRRGVDYNQLDETRTKSEYAPSVQVRPIIYVIYTPAPGAAQTTALALGFRMVERYDNRKKEVGFELNYYLDYASLVGLKTGVNKLYAPGFNLTMLFHHAWNLFGDEENYNKMRGSIYGAIGGTFAGGLLGGLIRAGYEWRFAKHWDLGIFAGYRPPTTVVLPLGVTAPMSGFEGGLGVSYLF